MNSLDLGPPCVPPWDPVELTAPRFLTKRQVFGFGQKRRYLKQGDVCLFVCFLVDLQVIEMSFENLAASNSYISISITIYNELVWVIKFFPGIREQNRQATRTWLCRESMIDHSPLLVWGEHPMLNHLWLEWRSIILHTVLHIRYIYIYINIFIDIVSVSWFLLHIKH